MRVAVDLLRLRFASSLSRLPMNINGPYRVLSGLWNVYSDRDRDLTVVAFILCWLEGLYECLTRLMTLKNQKAC